MQNQKTKIKDILVSLFMMLVGSLIVIAAALYIIFKIKTLIAIAVGTCILTAEIYLLIRTIIDIVKTLVKVLS